MAKASSSGHSALLASYVSIAMAIWRPADCGSGGVGRARRWRKQLSNDFGLRAHGGGLRADSGPLTWVCGRGRVAVEVELRCPQMHSGAGCAQARRCGGLVRHHRQVGWDNGADILLSAAPPTLPARDCPSPHLVAGSRGDHNSSVSWSLDHTSSFDLVICLHVVIFREAPLDWDTVGNTVLQDDGQLGGTARTTL